eukprot:9308981-Pyramimonas_sp.AAC.1
MGTEGHGYDAQEQGLLILSRTRCPRRRRLCPLETEGRLPNSGRCWFETAAVVGHCARFFHNHFGRPK